MSDPVQYMRRCLQLAEKGIGFVAPNPMVGAVLVYKDRIIGEGWHKKFGGPHAEVNCLKNVLPEDRKYIPDSTLYVSLEPCSHHGKTPPCTGLILEQGIRKVIIGCEDPFLSVYGTGISILKEKGLEVEVGLLENECREMNRRFMTYHQKKRPYVILKWAQTADGFIGTGAVERLLISNQITNRLVHKWRSEEAAILIGTNTASLDNPLLSARWGNQPQPVRIVVDRSLKLKKDLRIFIEGEGKVVILNDHVEDIDGRLHYVKLSKSVSPARAILDACYRAEIQSLLIEGGEKLLQSFINEELWDEARVITAMNKFGISGTPAPKFENKILPEMYFLQEDKIQIYHQKND